MAYKDNSPEAMKERAWIGCVDLHFEALKTQRMTETGKDGIEYAEAHSDLYQRGRGLFERFYKPEENNDNLYVQIARCLPSKPLFSPKVLINISDVRKVESELEHINLSEAIGHRTKVFLKAITPK